MVVNGYVNDLLSGGGWPRWPHFTLLDILYTAKIFYYCKYYIIIVKFSQSTHDIDYRSGRKD